MDESVGMTISFQEISKRAFEIWERDGKPECQDKEHWMRAEAELRKDSLKSQKGPKITSRDPAMLKTPDA